LYLAVACDLGRGFLFWEREMSGTVTAMKVQKRNPQRVNIYLDGEYAFGLARITAAWLQIGQQLSDEKIAQLRADDSHEAAYQKALGFLDYRPRSSAEVRRNLEKHGYDPEVIEQTLERLGRSGLVNDGQFAQTWVDNRSEFRPRGRRLLSMELRQKGLDDEAIESALSGLDEEELSYQAALKYQRKLQGLPKPDFRRKLAGFLAVLERVWQETLTNEDDN
jgi:regulatory protein